MTGKTMAHQLKQIPSVFLTHRRLGEAEAVYRVTPDMHLSESNVNCVYVQSGFPNTQFIHATKVSNDTHDPRFADNDSVFEITNRVGLYKESATLLYYYEHRDSKENADKLCYAQFSKEYEICRKKKGSSRKENVTSDDSEEEEYVDECSTDKDVSEILYKDRIWTGNYDEIYRLPNITKLIKIVLDENIFLKRRGFPNSIRFHKIKDKNSHEWLYSNFVLYRPFLNKSLDLQEARENAEACELMFLNPVNSPLIEENKEQIKNSFVIKFRQKVTPFIEVVQEACQQVAALNNARIGEEKTQKISKRMRSII